MYMRIRIESLDQNQFANEIGAVPVAEAIELNGGKYEHLPEDGL